MDPEKDGRKDLKKDMLAELDLPALFAKWKDADKKQKKATENATNAKARHLFWFWVIGLVVVCWAVFTFPEDRPWTEPAGSFVPGLVIVGIGMCIMAFLPGLTAYKRQAEATAATKSVKDIEGKIAFCNLVLDDAKTVKIRKYAEAWVEKELTSPPKT
jgi:hypothetical protein